MKRVALRLPEDGVWSGGVNYLETVCRALLGHPQLGYEPVVFCSPAAEPQVLARFQALLGSRLVCDAVLLGRRRAGLGGALLFGSNRALRALCERSDCSVIIEAADFYGWRFPVSCLAWVPDFQDRHLPQLFPRWWRYRRSLGMNLQLRSGRTVLLSSEDARRDCERFYPGSRGRTAVARFAVAPALEPGEDDPQIHSKHGLPPRFFYLPNQYWAHKNHARVVEAVGLLRKRGVSVVVASSGNPLDPRFVDHYHHLRCQVAAQGLIDNFLFLGNVPRRDVAILMRASVAMLNPSLFEGWSTTVEEGKSLAVRLLLSDLAVHHEQADGCGEFFDPYNPAAIAACLERVWLDPRQPPAVAEQRAAALTAQARVGEFAAQFTAACERAVGRTAARGRR
jgi:glycosyltransferase involved in cell wall biosynthesis